VGQRKQLWVLLLFFVIVGLFSGLAIWQINQSQQKERDLARSKTELEQTNQQLKLLKDQNTASITSRGKLQKELTAAKKQLETFQKQGIALETQFKAAQAQNIGLVSENSTLKARLSVAEKQLVLLQQNPKPVSSGLKPSPKENSRTIPNFLNP
jgi:chromosome segregation ATPase